MPAQVQVLLGPDRGWKYTILASGARIGRGNGHTIPLTDPAWPEGALAISQRGGGYLLTNQLPYPVYLDGQLLPPNEVRTFHHGAVLQPTAVTSLRLAIVEPPKGPMPPSGVLVAPPEIPQANKNRSRNLMIAVMVLAFGFLTMNEQFAKAADEKKLLETSLVHKDALWSLQREKGVPRELRPQIREAHERLASGFYEESLGDPEQAKKSYQEAREALDRLEKVMPENPALVEARKFVLERLTKLKS